MAYTVRFICGGDHDDNWLYNIENTPSVNRVAAQQREHIYLDEETFVKRKHIIKYSDGSKDVRQEYYDIKTDKCHVLRIFTS